MNLELLSPTLRFRPMRPQLITFKFVIPVAAGFFSIGCGKEESAAPAPAKSATVEQSADLLLGGSQSPARPAPTATPAPPPAAAGVPASKPKVDPVLKAAIERYFGESGRSPEAWVDLVKKGYLPAVPLDAAGNPLDFRQFLLDMR